MKFNGTNMNDEKIIKLYSEENKSTYEIAEIMKTYPKRSKDWVNN